MAASSRVRFVMAPDFEPRIMAAPSMRSYLQRETDEVARAARRLVPKRLHLLEQSIEAVIAFAAGRFVGRVIAKDFKAVWHEFGTRKMAATPYLRPALSEVLPGASIGGGSGG